MFTLILTGGIGSGKSTAAARLAEHGAMRVDLDRIARDIRESGEVTEPLVERFGTGILTPDGDIHPRSLAEAAFATPEGTQALDDIMHPLILQRTIDIVEGSPCFSEMPDVAVVEVPLLVPGSPYLDLADEVMAITAPIDIRVMRAISRGMTEDDVRERIGRQISDEVRASLADTVIDNSGTTDDLYAAIDAWWDVRAAQGFKSIRRRG
jgi:dephospho-CoA kinase